MANSLEGIRVLDLTRVLAGPYCTMLLADLGAEVIKVEQPKVGDDSRNFGPFKNGESSYYMFLNRGKKSITLNLKDAKAKQILLELVEHSDVVVENFKPGVMEKLGFGYQELRKVNPGIILCSISGFGQYGPYSDRPAYDLVVQAMGGMMSINGYPESPPSRTGISLGDMSAAMFAAMSIVTALYHKERTGQGQYLDISMMDSIFSFLESNVVRYSIGGVIPERVGSRHPLSAPFDIYKAKDGYIVIAVANDSLFSKFCHLMGRQELIDDARFRTNDNRSENEKVLKDITESWLDGFTVEEVIPYLTDVGIPASAVLDIEQVCKSIHIKEREMLIDIEHPVAGSTKIPGNPMKFSLTPVAIQKSSPLLGQHNVEVLCGLLNYGREQVKTLEDETVI